MECKFWILIEEFEIREEFAYNLTPASKREIKKIIYQHFDMIAEEWNKYFKKSIILWNLSTKYKIFVSKMTTCF